MKKIIDAIKAFFARTDHKLHIYVESLIALFAYIFGMTFEFGSFGSIIFALVVCAVAGFGKELIDKYIRKTPEGFDWSDIIADSVGFLIGFIPMIFYLLNRLPR